MNGYIGPFRLVALQRVVDNTVMDKPANKTAIPVPGQLFRGEGRLRIALVGMPNSGKSTLFKAVSSTAINTGELTGTHRAYEECAVQIGFDEARLVDLPSIHSLHHKEHDDLVALQYLLWGDEQPPISVHEPGGPPAPFAPPDVIIQVVDATALERHLELTLELSQLGRPMVIALNMVDEAWKKGLHINSKQLSKLLGVPVVPTVALMGQGISELFEATVSAVRAEACPLPQPASHHICDNLQPLSKALNRDDLHEAFRVPHPLLVMQIAAGDSYFHEEMQMHFPALVPELEQLRSQAASALPRPLNDEIHADRHHRAATLFEAVTRVGAPHEGRGWRYWLDELFLHPQWGLLGSLMVFAAVLFVVFEISVWLDSMTAARLIDWVSVWQPQSTGAVIGRAVVDGLIGLVGIVVPYMIPLCNVPAISGAAMAASGRERIVASLLITFVPCSARSAIILALAGKYLGGFGVFAIFMLTIVVIAIMGPLLTRRYAQRGPGQVQEIPAYALPTVQALLAKTWGRTRDILTIVTPLLVGGSIVLALLNHVGADAFINMIFTPITSWWLGLPVVLGVPILFGVLRKELSLLMIYQALGTFEVGDYLDWVQIVTFLVFLTFYIPCVSTFAVMLKTIGRKDAVFSLFLSVSVALVVSGIIRLLLESGRFLAG